MVPMVDLNKQFIDIKEEVFKVMSQILESSQYILGPKVREFERMVAGYIGVAEAIGVASGTDALHLALEALDIGEGDEVITTPFTFFATVEAILYTGATPVFVDIEDDSFNIDCKQIEGKITPHTKAILPVHLFGLPADMGAVTGIAERHGLYVIEDCAQAFGAEFKGRKVGGFGKAGCFSFYPSKNLGAYGDGGIITVNDRDIGDAVKVLRNHGSKGSYIHERIGFNSRLDEIQAGILALKMKKIDGYNSRRRQRAVMYNDLLRGVVKCPSEKEDSCHVYNQYTIMSARRNEIQQKLRENNISSVVYYPVPLHLQAAMSFLGHKKGDFPAAEKAAGEVLSLPLYPELEEGTIGRIADIIKEVA